MGEKMCAQFGGVGIRLNQINVVFCPISLKWTDVDGCHFCNCREYPGGDFRCDAGDSSYPSNDHRESRDGWTTDKLIAYLRQEDNRIRKLNVKEIRAKEISERKDNGGDEP